MDVVATVGADEQAASVVEPGEGALDDPAVASQPRAMCSLAARDQGFHSAPPDETPVLIVVVAAVGDEAVGASPRPADATANRWHPVE